MQEKSLSVYFKRVFSGTLLSRVSGMGRDLVMAFAFGDHPSVAAFMVAFRLSNLFRRLLGEGPLQSALIPHFEGLRLQDPERATFFFRRLSFLITVLLLGITLVSEGAIAGFLSWGGLSEGNREILSLMAWMMPAVVFICLYGLNISLLSCYDTFFIPSVAPFACNLVWIGAAFFLRGQDPGLAMPTLSKWIVVGFVGQWLLTLPQTVKFAGKREWLKFHIPDEVKTLAKSFALGAIGVGAMQINGLIDAIFARMADVRGPAYLWYSIRLEQLALAVFGIACITTVVPRLSRAIKGGDLAQAQAVFAFSYRRIMSIMIPCTVGMITVGIGAVNLIYGRGHFGEMAIAKTTLCLWAYGIGLVPTTLVILYSAIFYAKGNFRTPMWISLLTVGVNTALNAIFVLGFELGAISTALATSVSAFVNSWILSKMVKNQGWDTGFSMRRMVEICLACGIGFLFSFAVDHFLYSTVLMPFTGSSLPHTLRMQFISFFAPAMAFVGGIVAYAYAFRNADLLELMDDLILRKKKVVE